MRLQNIFRIFVAAMLTFGLAGSADAAKKRTGSRKAKAKTTAAAPAVRKGEIHTYGDVLTTQDFTYKKGKSKLSVEYPVGGNPVLVDAIRRAIADGICYDYAEGKKYTYSGPLDTPDAMMKKVLGSLGRGEELDETVKVSYIDSKVITINDAGYWYAGGAHGMPSDFSTSFLISDGTMLTLDMLPSISVMRPYIVSSLEDQWGLSSSDWSDSGLTDPSEIEYPGSNPYVTADGLNFTYGAYEIGPYSLGMPTATIAADIARRLLTGKAAQFF